MPELLIEQPGAPVRVVQYQDGEMTFGRAADNDVVLVADEVSRHHAKLCRRGNRVAVIDLKSLNGTFVNRQRIVERILADQDEIWFGGKCKIAYHENSTFEPTPAPYHETTSTLRADLERIRHKMDEVGSHLTLLGTRPAAGAQAPVLQATAEDLLNMSRAYRRLEALYRASKLIASEFDLNRRLASVLDTVMEVLEAERGFVLLRDEHTRGITVSVARGMGRELESGAPSMGIARRATLDGEPVLISNTSEHADLSSNESIISQSIVSAMCVPLRVEDRILGAVYVDTRKPGFAFDEADLELFASMAAQSAMAVENVHLYERMLETERRRANLSRFLSPAIVDEIMHEDSALELGGRKRVVTTLFCDIRGFTPLTESLDAVQVVALLTEHFTAMTEIIFNYKGTLDKYIGDEFMAVFGSPLSAEDDPERAVMAALAIQERNQALNELRKREQRPILEIGIGIDTGEAVAGTMGSPMRMEFTVVGDHVNTARRLCDMAKPGEVVIAEPTFQEVKHLVDATPIGPLTLEGKRIPVHAYVIRRQST